MTAISGFINRHLLWLIIAAYALAAVAPAFGEWIRHTAVFESGACGTIRLPVALLAILLFIAGQSVDGGDLFKIAKRPSALLAGLIASLFVPVMVVAAFAWLLTGWHDPGESQSLVLGLGIVAAMPVAGSSAAWSRHFGGNPALSIGLVVASTVLSPVTTPLALSTVDSMNERAADLGGSRTVMILLVSVVVPSIAGMTLRMALGDSLRHLETPRKLVASGVLLVLCYSNASASLPAVVLDPDWDYLALVILAAAGLCCSGFIAGWLVARIVRAGGTEQRSLIFGLGMTNNGTGLVLAGTGLAAVPAAMLPVIVYNLIQHIFAGAAGRWLEARSS